MECNSIKAAIVAAMILASCKPTYIVTGTDIQTGKEIVIHTKSDAQFLCDTVITDRDEIILINKIEKK